MKKITRPLALSIIIMLVLASCSFGTSAATEVPVQIVQPTPSIAQLATIELIVQATTSTPFTTVGQVITYNLNIKNLGATPAPGPVTVTGATVTCPAITTVGNLDASLDLNEMLPCTASYPITQADLDRGSVTIVTTATINGINSVPVTTTVPVGTPKVLTLTVTASPTAYDKAGQLITFTYVIKNSGAGNLGPAQFTVSPNITGSTPVNCGDANVSLAPNATVTCTTTYTVTDLNLTAGTLTNQATASGGGAGPSQAASVTINKGSVVPSTTCSAPGCVQHTVITGEWLWQIARCYGVDPNKLAVDNKAKLPNPNLLVPGTILSVNNPGSVSTNYGPKDCVTVVSHTIQTGDAWNSLAQKYGVNSTILQMANPNTNLTLVGTIIQLIIPNHTAGAVTTSSALTLTITANPLTYDTVGQVITFTYVIKNNSTGNLGPGQFTVSPNISGSTPINCGDANTSLTPGATVTCAIPYTVTDLNLTAATLTNQATASGGGAAASQTASVTLNKGIKALTLTISANPITYNLAGQIITFTYVITNSGTSNLGPAQFTVSPNISGSIPLNCGDANANLAPGATVTCAIPYTITDLNLTAATLTNQATASGGGAAASQVASVTLNKQ